ncbi:hypothetical protein TIFTF001_000521 [Ficus carica]|uniref:Uncharacterized protein n=1 Tax=Ficus carica TaxID=3494 RepID=A0AA87Z357_FICCA|nr:hypothetical protein TIFTF001_000521 [Ficus carica]
MFSLLKEVARSTERRDFPVRWLAVHLATYFKSEIINSDKMRVYKGLNSSTKKSPHRLIGEVDSEARGELTRSDSRFAARRKVSILAGRSNSFVHALLVDRFNPESDVFNDRPVPRIFGLYMELWLSVGR